MVTVSDPTRGEQAIAIVEPLPREQITCRDLLAFLRGRLPAAQVVDRIILVVELPRTRDGHPDRHRLRNMYSAAASPAHPGQRPEGSEDRHA